MRDYRRVLCPVDFSESTEAGLRVARAMAGALEADLFLLHVIEFPHESVAVERLYLEVEDAAAQRLGEMAETLGLSRTGSHVVVLRGAPYDRITQFAGEQNVDLIVMPTHGHSAIDRFVFGSVAQRVLRMADCPVIAVPMSADPESPDGGTVIHATDFSATADRALADAEQFARALGVTLTIAHVLTLAERGQQGEGWRFPVIPPDVEQAETATAEFNLQERRARADGPGHRVETRLIRGPHPALAIAELASEIGAGLIVVASHGHSAVARALLGSTSEKLVRVSKVPVMVVRPEAE